MCLRFSLRQGARIASSMMFCPSRWEAVKTSQAKAKHKVMALVVTNAADT